MNLIRAVPYITSVRETLVYDGEAWSAGPDLPVAAHACHASPIDEEATRILIATTQSGLDCKPSFDGCQSSKMIICLRLDFKRDFMYCISFVGNFYLLKS